MNLDNLKLHGRVALVTGGSRGIGLAVVQLLAALGANVAINYVSDEVSAAEAVGAAEAKGVKAISLRANVENQLEAQQLVEETISTLGRLDILICNAGIWEGAPVDQIDEALWDRTLDINLKGTWAVCRAAVPPMKQQRFGKIVIVTSTAGQRGEANYSNYAASKAGQIGFVKSLGAELAEWGINVNGVAPGWVDTDMTREALGAAEQRRTIASQIPVGEIAKPEDIAAPIVFLCTDWARHITGEILNVNGGSVLCG